MDLFDWSPDRSYANLLATVNTRRVGRGHLLYGVCFGVRRHRDRSRKEILKSW